jgi:hypothetical protein
LAINSGTLHLLAQLTLLVLFWSLSLSPSYLILLPNVRTALSLPWYSIGNHPLLSFTLLLPPPLLLLLPHCVIFCLYVHAFFCCTFCPLFFSLLHLLTIHYTLPPLSAPRMYLSPLHYIFSFLNAQIYLFYLWYIFLLISSTPHSHMCDN